MIFGNWKPFKNDKNFSLFYLDCLRFDWKHKVNFKIYDVANLEIENGGAYNSNQRNKGNQRTTFGQLIECNMRKHFHEKSYTKCDEKTTPLFSNFVLYSTGHFSLTRFDTLKLCNLPHLEISYLFKWFLIFSKFWVTFLNDFFKWTVYDVWI